MEDYTIGEPMLEEPQKQSNVFMRKYEVAVVRILL